jgi:hypothetical protein
MGAKTTAVTAALAVIVLAAGAATGDSIFVTNYATGTNGWIGKYTTSGATVDASLISGLPGPSFLAVFGSNLYVANYNGGTIGVYDMNTGAAVNPSLISIPGHHLSAVVVSGSSLFLTDYDAGTIGQYDINTGAAINASLVSGLDHPSGLLVSGSTLLVADTGNGAVGQYTITGETVNASLVSGLNFATGGSFGVCGSRLFVTDTGDGTLNEYDVNTGAPVSVPLISGLSYPSSIAFSGSSMFIVNQHEPYSIGEYTLSGEVVDPALIVGLNVPVGILIVPDPHPGDADLDGDVDLDDFVALKSNFGVGTTWGEGDFDGDNDVDLDDFVILKSNFGTAAIPEPAAL